MRMRAHTGSDADVTEEFLASRVHTVTIPTSKVTKGSVKYVLLCESGSGQWAIGKRYSEFETLKKAISKQSDEVKKFPFPGKSTFGGE